MITNDRIKHLIETDREALIQLMAAAYAVGERSWIFLGYDPDARALLDEVKAQAQARLIDRDRLTRWNADVVALARWSDLSTEAR